MGNHWTQDDEDDFQDKQIEATRRRVNGEKMTTEDTTKKKRSAPKDALTRLREMRDQEARRLEKLRDKASAAKNAAAAAVGDMSACEAGWRALDSAVKAQECPVAEASPDVAHSSTLPAPMVTGKAGRA